MFNETSVKKYRELKGKLLTLMEGLRAKDGTGSGMVLPIIDRLAKLVKQFILTMKESGRDG